MNHTIDEKPRLKEHLMALMVNRLRDTAIGFYDHESLRQRILGIVKEYIEPGTHAARNAPDDVDEVKVLYTIENALGMGITQETGNIAFNVLQAIRPYLAPEARNAPGDEQLREIVWNMLNVLALVPDSYRKLAHDYTPGFAKYVEQLEALRAAGFTIQKGE